LALLFKRKPTTPGWAFSKISFGKKEKDLKALLAMPVTSWQKHIQNDFEKPVFDAHPEIAELKSDMIRKDAIYASMTGSGSTVFGIFDKKTVPRLKYPSHYFSKWV